MELQEIKSIPIIEYARVMGFHPVKVGRRYYTLSEHDSVRIDYERNIFIRNSTGEKGSVIDFVMAFNYCDAREAIRMLKEYGKHGAAHQSRPSYEKKTERKPVSLTLPVKDTSMRNAIAYLIKTRKISKGIVQEFIDNKMLYQDTHKNCVFVSYENDIPKFAMKRGTNTYKRFVCDVEGSDYRHSFFIDHDGYALIVTESVIDAMSVMSLLDREGVDYRDYDYLALQGVNKYETALSYHLPKHAYRDVILCLDADEAGQRAMEKIKEYVNELYANMNIVINPPKGENIKDYNDLLRREAERTD